MSPTASSGHGAPVDGSLEEVRCLTVVQAAQDLPTKRREGTEVDEVEGPIEPTQLSSRLVDG